MSISRTPFERLYIGDISAVERVATGNPLHIPTVVSVCADSIKSKSSEINYLQIPILDAQPLPFEAVEDVMSAISHYIVAGPVVIQCAAGMSRSPVMAAIYLDLVGYRSFDSALDELARLRPIDPAPVIVRSAREYLKKRVQEVKSGVHS